MTTDDADAIARAFVDHIELDPLADSLGALVARVAGTFGGGLAVTALLAALLHH